MFRFLNYLLEIVQDKKKKNRNIEYIEDKTKKEDRDIIVFGSNVQNKVIVYISYLVMVDKI
jgi:hypothetical protein